MLDFDTGARACAAKGGRCRARARSGCGLRRDRRDRPAELANVPQALKCPGVDERERELVDADVVPERVAQNLESHGSASDPPRFVVVALPRAGVLLSPSLDVRRTSRSSSGTSPPASSPACRMRRRRSTCRAGSRTSAGTSGTAVGTASPNTGSVRSLRRRRACRREQRSTIARVYASFMRLPVPYAPPLQPVFTSHTVRPVLVRAARRASPRTSSDATRGTPRRSRR